MKYFLHQREDPRIFHNLESTTIVGDMVGVTPIIYATLEGWKADHKLTVIKIEGKIVDKYSFVLIDPRSTYSYVKPRIVDIFFLVKKHDKSWLVQLAIGTKRKVCEVVTECQLDLNGLSTIVHLNVFPLGLSDVLMGMDWLEDHRAKVDCFNKVVECIDGKGMPVEVRGILQPILVKHISTSKL